jgi:hypothetical protein
VDILIAILALALLAVVILVVSAPLRAAWSRSEGESLDERARPGQDRIASAGDPVARAEDRAELEVAREAKYREIRDAEMDYRTGKLSTEDFAATDGALRAEALKILDRLAALEDDAALKDEGARPRDA